MEQGKAVTQLAQATSTSALFARIVARSKGSPVPFLAGSQPAKADVREDGVYANGKKITQWNKYWMDYDNLMLLSIAMPAGFVWFMNRVPK
mmetsp:Transcript_55104/g.98333  ORF Transcript_55104/g.98333 Transcript_55104/m.98333 type:complete len:91 (-) Transcript_55104:58-330(-)|eukprot:CAMPEP_0197659986 /NCGR_PEP_ID=MMETSP1338-20131121/49975_1 /TAXON_ID=43686 ORGANISM="Pelagodinium beii, Strain RCC1491" /NCGR_SAMPLE_ID=MMETSP1338 /ASSEMBLY_ACC=CAM_ASM_000754 /LENGTH=90 /DNA_ID=CAMNT_0043237205 /DNA_START=64 /DNA_END=336 /DNA_ORIENTATION=-